MNTLEFYPAASTPGTTYLTETTDVVTSISYTDAEKIAEPYYMGYIKWDDVPDVLKTSYFEFVSDLDNDYFECRDITIAENIPWFFTGKYFTSASNQMHIIYYPYDNSTFKYIVPSNTLGLGEFRFLNRGKIPELSSSGNVFIHFTTCAINNNVSPVTYATSNASNAENDHYMTFPQFLDFLKDQYTITVSFTKYSETFTVNLKFSDLKDGYYIHDTPLGNTLKIFITDFRLPTTDRDINEQGNLRYWSTVQAGILMHYDDPRYGIRPVISNSNQWSYTSGNYIAINYTNKSVSNARNYSPMDYRIIRGGWRCKIPGSFFRNAESGRTEIYGNCVIYKSNSTNFQLFRLFTPTEIYHNFSALFTRICTNSDEYGFSNNVYVPVFNEDNSPKWEFVHGAIADIQEKLQLWQYQDVTDNTFKPADIPEYNPGGGGDGENVGDNIIRPATLGIGGTNGFVTQYALRASDIQELGQILWTSVFDSDYWQNYMFSLALDTGSFSMSSLLSFFVSLKVYPFALINVPSYVAIGKNMYIGTGIHALEFTNNLHTINNYCDYIPGGSCTVWSGYFFNDYRDYINATYTLYVPYCGTIELNPGDVVHSTLTVQYAVDFATGGCVAYVDIITQDGAQFTIAALPGQMGADVPLTATAAGAVASRFVGDAMKFGGLISGEVSQVAGGIASGMMGKAPSGGTGNVLSGMAGMIGGLPAAVGMDLAPGIAMQAANMIARGAVAAPMMSGGQGFASFGAPQTPYVQIRRGIYPDVSGLSTVCGSRGAGTYTIGDLSGFVQGDIKTDGLNCPENEKIQIRQLIAKGIYV